MLASRLVWLACPLALIAADPQELPPAVVLWQQGQDAMLADQVDQAISCYHLSLKVDPTLLRNFLSLAAAHVHKGEDEQAAPWLGRYVALQPDHLVARSHYAELLYKLKQPDAAQVQYQRFVREMQIRQTLPMSHLVHAHTRLMEIARAHQDEPGENLHRGIALFWSAEADPEAERLRIQATVHLMQARNQRPESARACWYLYRVWSRLGQQQTAWKWLTLTEEAVTLPEQDLTTGEMNEQQLATATRDRERQR